MKSIINALTASGLILGMGHLAATPAEVKNTSAKSAETKNHAAEEVSLAELKTLVETKKAFIIDANSKSSYKDGHIPGAISFAAHEDDLAKVLPQDKNALIIAYCGGPMCTAWEDPAKMAKKLGYSNIKHYKGGISTWKKEGQKVEKI